MGKFFKSPIESNFCLTQLVRHNDLDLNKLVTTLFGPFQTTSTEA
jgi:hypothetical protein